MKKLFQRMWMFLGFLLIEEMANGQEENAARFGNTSQSTTYIDSSECAIDGDRGTQGVRINGAVIRVGNFLDIYSNPICGVISTLSNGAMATFSCHGMEGRHVVVHIPGNQKILSLAEFGVYGYLAGNMAAGGAVLLKDSLKDCRG